MRLRCFDPVAGSLTLESPTVESTPLDTKVAACMRAGGPDFDPNSLAISSALCDIGSLYPYEYSELGISGRK